MLHTKPVLLTYFFTWAAPQPPPPPAPVQPPLPVDPVDSRDWEDCGFDEDLPGSPPSCDDMDMALAALLKRLLGNNAEELDGLLKGQNQAQRVEFLSRKRPRSVSYVI